MYVTRFTVEGSGHFPIDMLRYDRCYPDGQDDVGEIDVCHHDGDDYFKRIRKVNLVTFHAIKGGEHVTVARWASFGWKVTNVTYCGKV